MKNTFTMNEVYRNYEVAFSFIESLSEVHKEVISTGDVSDCEVNFVMANFNEEVFESCRSFIVSIIRYYANIRHLDFKDDTLSLHLNVRKSHLYEGMTNRMKSDLDSLLLATDAPTASPRNTAYWCQNRFREYLCRAVLVAKDLIGFSYSNKELCS